MNKVSEKEIFSYQSLIKKSLKELTLGEDEQKHTRNSVMQNRPQTLYTRSMNKANGQGREQFTPMIRGNCRIV